MMHDAPRVTPRIYTSYADLAADLGCPMAVAHVTDKPAESAAAWHLEPIPKISPAALRAEGVIDVGCAPGTSTLYVRTRVKLHLFHVTWLPDRVLDDYAVKLAITWLEEHGLPSYEVAANLGIHEASLRVALVKAGHDRWRFTETSRRARASTARKARKKQPQIAAPR